MKRKVIIVALAGLLAFALAAVLAGRASAQPAPPRAVASCNVGSWAESTHYGPPGSASIHWTNNSTPTTCESLRVRIESANKLYYEGKWIHYTGDGSSTASTAKCRPSCDGSALLKASIEKEPTGNGAKCQIREFWPTAGKWVACPALARTTAAVSQHWTYAKLRAALSGAGPYLICALHASKTLQRMGAYYELAKPSVTGKTCDASRQWEWYAQGDDYNGVPQGNFKAVGDGWWLAASKFCAWTVRHSDRKTTGTLWKLFLDKKNNFYIANAKCSGVDDQGLPRYTEVMTTDNRPTSQWFIANRNHPNRGDYTHLILKIPPSHVAHTTALVKKRSCSLGQPECYGYDGYTGQPGWFQVRWETNEDIWYIRALAVCGNGTRNKIFEKSGWITAIDKWSRASCTSGYPNLDRPGYDIKHCASCTVHRTWVTIPGRVTRKRLGLAA